MSTLPASILLSRTDGIGDAVITTAMAGVIKSASSNTRVSVLARRLTAPIWQRCRHVDEILTLEDLEAAGDQGAVARLADLRTQAIVHVFRNDRIARWAAKARIPIRVGSNRQLIHWRTCNRLVGITRKRSRLHEAQINIQLLRPFGIPVPSPYQALGDYMGLSIPSPSAAAAAALKADRRNIVLHTMSTKGQRWGFANFAGLMNMLDPARHHVLLTGTEAEAKTYRGELPVHLSNVTDLGGRLPPDDMWGLIAGSDALVACSTGPLHLAAAAGIRTVGVYPNFRAINPDRWGPIGRNAVALIDDPNCPTCAKGHCDCITRISPERVYQALLPAIG